MLPFRYTPVTEVHMPTIKPRFTITLKPETFQLISAAAAEQGISKSELIAEFLEMAREPLERMVTLLRAAKAAPADARADLLRGLEMAERGLVPLAQSAIGQADLLIDLALQAGRNGGKEQSAARHAAAPAPKKPARATRPPPANRGVTPPHPTPHQKTRKAQKVVGIATARAARDAKKGRGVRP